ncbi:2,3-bisphosphoglycerate-independent phosphoglycerate mutase [Candidatus Dojkabacteria bacterium]|uniref:2,3-bisphosphoglycerate-independent phosphoglycerate mutase n=1 Tax=Candidatus Dojkabacteria bacterium TaxID=2099670 RepID=A0A955RKU6_9BACT|nr:2,3-bisphosphoglycerate-independent phosphoglycerate mutase [Candidatus Dojkabacteria bacterium]
MNKKAILLILDGWGMAKPDKFNAIDNAKTPNFDFLRNTYAYTELKAHGEFVGLPEGQMGTSEVNHLAIGTGRILQQTLPLINSMVENNGFAQNEQIKNLVQHVIKNESALHLVGIVSDGGVHYHMNHLFAFLKFLQGIEFKQEVYIHVFADGRDTPPKSIEGYLEELEKQIESCGIGNIASFQGRVYLDRDRDWDKTEKAFQLIKNLEGEKMQNWRDALNKSYEEEKVENDQYHKQYFFEGAKGVEEGDALFIWGFRTDRQFQILKRILDEKIKNFRLTSFINPSKDFDFDPIFPENVVEKTLAELVDTQSKKQLHITETEKYTHLTYFFNGRREVEFSQEAWELLQSNRYVKPDYNFEPSMRAFNITKEITESIENDTYDLIVANYPNTDMVGHTGNYEAAVIAAESVDYCLGKIYEALKDRLDEYTLFITADHGNSDEMWDYEANQPHSQHTLNPVPFITVTNEDVEITNADLLDGIAPTILSFMGIEVPSEMTGKPVVVKK